MRRSVLVVCFLILPALALSSYICVEEREARKAKAQMRADETEAMREIVNQATRRYIAHEGKPPQSIDDLVLAGYLPERGPMYFDPAVPPPPSHRKSASVPAN